MNPRAAYPVFRWVGRLGRTCLATSFVFAVFGGVAARIGYARMNDAALHFGDELLKLSSPSDGAVGAAPLRTGELSGEVEGDVYRMNLNGQAISITSATTDRSPSVVLDYFERECKARADGLGERFTALYDTLRDMPPSSGNPGFATLRDERGPKGFVVCFATARSMSTTEQIRALTDAATSGDIGRIGDVRYVVAESAGEGSNVVSAWTHGSFNVREMFPPKGDAPGKDWPMAPRPAGSRRVLTAFVEGAPYGVNVYQLSDPADRVREAVERDFLGRGWTKAYVPPQVQAASRAYARDGVDLVVTATDDPAGGTAVSYVSSVMPGHSEAAAH